MPDAFDHCEALVREADRDRFLATLFAPAARRPALFALYAFDIEMSRVREAAREPLPGEIRLQWWRDVFDGLREEEARAHPVAESILDAVTRYRLPAQAFVDLIDARTFDLYDEPMQTVAQLEDYGRKTSSALMSLAGLVLNDGNDAGIDPLTDHVGIAQALTAVLLGLPRHAARRQLYLPLELLRDKGVEADDALTGKATPELREALSALRQRARHHLSEAKSVMAAVPETIAPAFLPVALIRPTLDRMERRGCDPFRPDVLPQWRRQWILWRAARRGVQRAL